MQERTSSDNVRTALWAAPMHYQCCAL